jgi:hypothetical protein
MSDILIGVIVFGLVFGAAIFGMFLGRNLRVLEQKLTRATLLRRGYSVLSKLSEADVRRRIFMELIYLSYLIVVNLLCMLTLPSRS